MYDTGNEMKRWYLVHCIKFELSPMNTARVKEKDVYIIIDCTAQHSVYNMYKYIVYRSKSHFLYGYVKIFIYLNLLLFSVEQI